MRARKIDTNQNEIVKVLRQLGCTVQILSQVGQGCPDILVGFQGRNFLLEIKDGKKFLSQRKLTPDEAQWHSAWRGQVQVVETIEQAIQAVCVARAAGPGNPTP